MAANKNTPSGGRGVGPGELSGCADPYLVNRLSDRTAPVIWLEGNTFFTVAGPRGTFTRFPGAAVLRLKTAGHTVFIIIHQGAARKGEGLPETGFSEDAAAIGDGFQQILTEQRVRRLQAVKHHPIAAVLGGGMDKAAFSNVHGYMAGEEDQVGGL